MFYCICLRAVKGSALLHPCSHCSAAPPFCRRGICVVAYHRILQSAVVVFRGAFDAVERMGWHLIYYAAEGKAWGW